MQKITAIDHKTGYPDLCLNQQDDEQDYTLKECHGPSFIIEKFREMDPQEPKIRIADVWKVLTVYRAKTGIRVRRTDDDMRKYGIRRLGTLRDLRQSFHLWEEEKQKWEDEQAGIIRDPGPRRQWDSRPPRET